MLTTADWSASWVRYGSGELCQKPESYTASYFHSGHMDTGDGVDTGVSFQGRPEFATLFMYVVRGAHEVGKKILYRTNKVGPV